MSPFDFLCAKKSPGPFSGSGSQESFGNADLFRIKGIAGQTAELLEAGGVDSVAELAQRNAANLAAKLKEVNDAKKLTGKVPTEKQVGEWIGAAKALPKKVTY